MVGKIALYAAALCILVGCERLVRGPKSSRCRGKASAPSPADGAKGVSPDTKLSWTGVPCADSYKVHFGATSRPPFVSKQTGTAYDPGPLDWDKTYYWRIDIVGGEEGEIWKFTTFWYGDPNYEEMEVRQTNEGAHYGRGNPSFGCRGVGFEIVKDRNSR